MPTIDTLATLSSDNTSLAPTAGAMEPLSNARVRLNSLRCTVKVKSVVPATDWFCTIISTSILASATLPKIAKAIPGLSGTPNSVTLASSRLKAMPETTAASIFSSSSKVIRVPERISSSSDILGSVSDDSTRVGTRYLPANSTERICNTLEPSEAISSISSNEMTLSRRASGSTRGSVV